MGDIVNGDKIIFGNNSRMIKIEMKNYFGSDPRRDDDIPKSGVVETEEAEYEEVDEHKPQAEETEPPANNTTPPPQISNVDLFVNRVKDIVTKAAEKNGQQIDAKPNGWSVPYIYNIDAKRICDIMDDLRKNHERYITNVIKVYPNPVGTTLIGAFIGKILKIEGIACSELQFSDMNFAIKYFYNDVQDPSKRLSDKFKKEVKSEGELLINTFVGLMKKHK